MSVSGTLPVAVLFGGSTSRQLIDWILTEMEPDEQYEIRQITEQINASRSAVGEHYPKLVEFGLLSVVDEEAYFPRLERADTRVVDLLTSWEGYPPRELFATSAMADLVVFFVASADPEESYSYNSVSDAAGVSYHSAMNYMDNLVDAGLVETVEGTRATEYRVDTDSGIYELLQQLNEALYAEYTGQ